METNENIKLTGLEVKQITRGERPKDMNFELFKMLRRLFKDKLKNKLK